MKQYGEFWRRARLRRGYSQKKLSLILGFSTAQFVSNVERGNSRYPLTLMSKLIRVLDLDPDAVVGLILREEKRRIHYAMGIKKNCGTE